MNTPDFTEINAIMHNGSLNAALNVMTRDHVLYLGAQAFESATGSTAERLKIALVAMTKADRVAIPQLEIPADLDQLTVPQLKARADELGVRYHGLRRRDDIIEAFHREQRRRAAIA